MTIYVFGHKSPDTDTIVSAIAAAYLLRARGFDAIAAAQGAPPPESRFVLDKFELPTPEPMQSVAGKDVAVVDTTEPSQLPSDMAEADVKFVFDHHNLGGLKTKAAAEIWARPVGCTCTVLKEIFDFFRIEIPTDIAGAMMCAILSDTVLFKSPTTTEADKRAVDELEKKSGLFATDIGMDMLRVKSSIESDSARDLLNRDFKEFMPKGKLFGIGQVELVDIRMIDSKLAEIKSEMKALKAAKGYWGVLMMITDIIRGGSILVAFTDDDAKIE
ncbi:MAG: manganese-dependent inorganic pyrophosphatase, partial [Rickettsiales bacterium]|nr:manganese-dependent inorganic pyrophosphatase [Rickettsiales bacterium]